LRFLHSANHIKPAFASVLLTFPKNQCPVCAHNVPLWRVKACECVTDACGRDRPNAGSCPRAAVIRPGPDAEKARSFAKELIGMSPDVIVSSTNQVTAILQQETRTIPIVFAFVGDPVGSGFVQSLSRPGGNLTGFANFENSIGGKWLELVRELAPKAKRVGFVYCPTAAPNVGFFHAAQNAATSPRVTLIPLPVNNGIDIERNVTALAAEPDGSLIVAPHAVTLGNRDLIDKLALRYRLPTVYSDRYFVESGGLISFGNNTPELFGRAASYVDRILKGANPAELPVQLPTKFELVLNLKAAKAIGLSVPPAIISRADDVIE
jgi:putative ABC transport system substrate-binding protein